MKTIKDLKDKLEEYNLPDDTLIVLNADGYSGGWGCPQFDHIEEYVEFKPYNASDHTSITPLSWWERCEKHRKKWEAEGREVEVEVSRGKALVLGMYT